MEPARYVFFGMAAIPFIYYLLALYSSWRFFRDSRSARPAPSSFTPPVSNLKPVRGLDPDAYENFASFCRQDYPEYEIVFCLGDRNDPALRVIEQLTRDFPGRSIRVLFSAGSTASNDKVAKLVRLAAEARYEHLVISDSDGRVGPDYLLTIIAPLADPQVGAVTCLYVPADEKTFAERLQTTGMLSDFYAGIMVARQLDGVKFAFGATIATTRATSRNSAAIRRWKTVPPTISSWDASSPGMATKWNCCPTPCKPFPTFNPCADFFRSACAGWWSCATCAPGDIWA